MEILNSKILITEDLSIGYKQKNNIQYLQKCLELSLYKGDLVCLIGPNGCGKSTLIRTLSAIQEPLTGIIKLEDKSISDFSVQERTKLISTVLTDKTVVDQITVEQIVSLGRYHNTNWLGDLSEYDRKKVSNSIRSVGLAGLEKRQYYTLSDGERQRAFIAKALASDAHLMLLDEPTAHLDIVNRVGILSLLRQLTHNSGKTILVSSHDLELAMQLADEVWLMAPGKGILKGTPEEIVTSGLLDMVFGNELIRYNETAGSFTLKKQVRQAICLSGEGEKFELTRKALDRLGFEIDTTETKGIKIQVKNDCWEIFINTNRYVQPDLAGTCRLIRKLLM